MTSRECISVAVRIRPLNPEEKNHPTVVRAIDQSSLIFDPKDVNKREVRGIPNHHARKKDVTFSYDRVYDGLASSREIFQQMMRPLVDDLFQGYNCSCFAYGATSSGKTFTMIGTESSPGVMVLTMQELFDRMEMQKDEFTYSIQVSYLEVYNEQVRDLLSSSTQSLSIREDAARVTVTGLSTHQPKTLEEVFQLLQTGNSMRTQAPTDANSESSRSHAVFQVTIQTRQRVAGLVTAVKVGKLSLIDLAGSERAARTKNVGARFAEGANINRSLLALGNCITALAKAKPSTRDSLGGNCKTVMIATVTPSLLNYDDSFNTLQYAERARKIQMQVFSNQSRLRHHPMQYGALVETLNAELVALRHKLVEADAVAHHRIDQSSNEEVIKYDTRLQSLYKDLEIIESEFRKLDSELEQVEANILYLERQKKRACSVSNNFETPRKVRDIDETISRDAMRVVQLKWNEQALNLKLQNLLDELGTSSVEVEREKFSDASKLYILRHASQLHREIIRIQSLISEGVLKRELAIRQLRLEIYETLNTKYEDLLTAVFIPLKASNAGRTCAPILEQISELLPALQNAVVPTNFLHQTPQNSNRRANRKLCDDFISNSANGVQVFETDTDITPKNNRETTSMHLSSEPRSPSARRVDADDSLPPIRLLFTDDREAHVVSQETNENENLDCTLQTQASRVVTPTPIKKPRRILEPILPATPFTEKKVHFASPRALATPHPVPSTPMSIQPTPIRGILSSKNHTKRNPSTNRQLRVSNSSQLHHEDSTLPGDSAINQALQNRIDSAPLSTSRTPRSFKSRNRIPTLGSPKRTRLEILQSTSEQSLSASISRLGKAQRVLATPVKGLNVTTSSKKPDGRSSRAGPWRTGEVMETTVTKNSH